MKNFVDYIIESIQLNEAETSVKTMSEAAKTLNSLLKDSNVPDIKEYGVGTGYKFNDKSAYNTVLRALKNMKLNKACYINIDNCDDKESYLDDKDYYNMLNNNYSSLGDWDVPFYIGYSNTELMLIIAPADFDEQYDYMCELHDENSSEFEAEFNNLVNKKLIPAYKSLSKVGQSFKAVKDKYTVL